MPISPLPSLSPVDAGPAAPPQENSRTHAPPSRQPWQLDDRQMAMLEAIERNGLPPRPAGDALDRVVDRLPQWDQWCIDNGLGTATPGPRRFYFPDALENAGLREVMAAMPECILPSSMLALFQRARLSLDGPQPKLSAVELSEISTAIDVARHSYWSSDPGVQNQMAEVLRHFSPVTRWYAESPDEQTAAQRGPIRDWAFQEIFDAVEAGRPPALPRASDALITAYEQAQAASTEANEGPDTPWDRSPERLPGLNRLATTLDERFRDDASPVKIALRAQADAWLAEIAAALKDQPDLDAVLEDVVSHHEGLCTDAWMRTLANVAAAASCGRVDNGPEAARWIARTALLRRADEYSRDANPDHAEVIERAGAMRTLVDLKLARLIDWSGPISPPVRFALEAGLPADFSGRLVPADEWPEGWRLSADTVIAKEVEEGFPNVRALLEEDGGVGALLKQALARDPAFIQTKQGLEAQLMLDYEAAQDADPDDIDAGNALDGPHREAVDAALKAPLNAVLDQLRKTAPTDVD